MSMTVAEAGEVWRERPIPAPEETVRLDVGPLTVWLKTVQNELWIAWVRSADAEHPDRTHPEAPAWSRWALQDGQKHLKISPALPDRALVVKPEHPFTLVRRASARIYMRVPVWVRFEVLDRQGGKGTLLTEIPTLALSDTWWGDFADGELAYWLTTQGRRAVTPDLFLPHLAISAVQLDNVSDSDLPVEKHILRVENLSIFEAEGRLWAEEVSIKYRGEDEGAEILMRDKPPLEAPGARELSPARLQRTSFKARTFARLRALSGWGD